MTSRSPVRVPGRGDRRGVSPLRRAGTADPVVQIASGEWRAAPELAYPAYVALLRWRRATFPPVAELEDGLLQDARHVWAAGEGPPAADARVAAAWLNFLSHTHAAIDRWHSVMRWLRVYEQYSEMHGRQACAQPTHHWQLFALARAAERWGAFSTLRVRAFVALSTAATLSRHELYASVLARWHLAACALRYAAAFGALSPTRLLFVRWAKRARAEADYSAERGVAQTVRGVRAAARVAAVLTSATLARALRTWAGASARVAANAARLRHVVAAWRAGSLGAAARTWRATAGEKSRTLGLVGRVLRVLRGVRAGAALRTWGGRSDARRGALELMRGAASRLRGSRLAAAALTWAEHARANGRRLRAMRMAGARWALASLAIAHAHWRGVSDALLDVCCEGADELAAALRLEMRVERELRVDRDERIGRDIAEDFARLGAEVAAARAAREAQEVRMRANTSEQLKEALSALGAERESREAAHSAFLSMFEELARCTREEVVEQSRQQQLADALLQEMAAKLDIS
ncbi:hypothetical protein T492DRAFT_1034586 [Pavlovales sp. CCMP2436]|nr:hypothetical protein T492DRAFT_1034586 [Pavlovales sp. CCMP2436]